jgi:beta-lactamase regulating signal transducer with metallopeptidase domain
MSSWAQLATEHLWRSALAAVPLGIVVAAICRFSRCGPSTRHTLWLLVLAWFIVPLVLPAFRAPSETAAARTGSFDDRTVAVRTAEPAIRNETSLLGARPDGRSEARRAGEVQLTKPTPPWTAARSRSDEPAWLATARDFLGRLSHLVSAVDWAEMWRGMQVAAQTERTCPAQVESQQCDSKRQDVAACDLTDRPAVHAGELAADTVESIADTCGASTSSVTPSSDLARQSAEAGALVQLFRRWRDQLQAWTVGLLGVRDAIGRLPGLPADAWLAGAMAACLIGGLRIASFSRRLRNCRPAPDAIAEIVRHASLRMHLRRAPEVWMTDERISPMIWCGRRTRLILPRGLWGSLDPIGRRAVIYHELAHLRRRDHWIRWIEIVIGCVYWWHPVVWWVRRRLQEEADMCCDAWVTSVLPRERRAYADALLATTRYINEGAMGVPATGIGMATVRASRFARRLTMVMTETKRPRISVACIGLVCMLAVAGWLATPRSQARRSLQPRPRRRLRPHRQLLLRSARTGARKESMRRLFTKGMINTQCPSSKVATDRPATPPCSRRPARRAVTFTRGFAEWRKARHGSMRGLSN